MEIFSGDESYVVLFILSFAASTILPLGSEWLLVSMVLSGSSLPLSVMTASSGNYLGAVTTYLIGFFGGAFLIRKIFKIDSAKEERAKNLYFRYGTWSLLLSWLPVIGDPLCLAGGLMKVGFARFSILVIIGKVARYSALAYLAREGAGLI